MVNVFSSSAAPALLTVRHLSLIFLLYSCSPRTLTVPPFFLFPSAVSEFSLSRMVELDAGSAKYQGHRRSICEQSVTVRVNRLLSLLVQTPSRVMVAALKGSRNTQAWRASIDAVE
jgi:hypothetical protein